MGIWRHWRRRFVDGQIERKRKGVRDELEIELGRKRGGKK